MSFSQNWWWTICKNCGLSHVTGSNPFPYSMAKKHFENEGLKDINGSERGYVKFDMFDWCLKEEANKNNTI